MYGCITFPEFIQICYNVFLNSNMEAGLPFDLSNSPPPNYLEAVKEPSYKTNYSKPSFSAGVTSLKSGTFTEFEMDELNGDDS